LIIEDKDELDENKSKIIEDKIDDKDKNLQEIYKDVLKIKSKNLTTKYIPLLFDLKYKIKEIEKYKNISERDNALSTLKVHFYD